MAKRNLEDLSDLELLLEFCNFYYDAATDFDTYSYYGAMIFTEEEDYEIWDGLLMEVGRRQKCKEREERKERRQRNRERRAFDIFGDDNASVE